MAYVGLWRGFPRSSALRWASAWLIYAVGLMSSAGVTQLFYAGTFTAVPPRVWGLILLPLILGVFIFRVGTDSLVQATPVPLRRYVIGCAAVSVTVLGTALVAGPMIATEVPATFPYIFSRAVMAVGFAVTAWPLLSPPDGRRRWLLIVVLALLCVRFLAAAGYEVWEIAHGVGGRTESPLLTLMQVILMIMFGLATAFALVERERDEALQAAETIRRTSEALRESEARLARAQRLDSPGQMAGSVAHDFNNTLGAVISGLELAGSELPPGTPAAYYLDLCRQAGEKGANLTRQLLAFARQSPVTQTQFDVAERVAALKDVVGLAVGRSVRLRIHADDHRLPVQADPNQFDQVIVNLALNARDAMPAGGDLTISASRGDTVARVTVEDTGAGIPTELLDRIFEPFFTTKPEGQGTGLGLATAYGFARQAGGILSVASTVGSGTRFTLDLPLDIVKV